MLTRIHPGNGKTNEHGNWHLRYYFPKGTDFREVSEEELQDVVAEINTRPRKILGYMTAQEKFDQSSFAGIPGRKSGEEEHSRFGWTSRLAGRAGRSCERIT